MNPVYAMSRSVGVAEYQELDVSTMDPISHQPAFRGLKLYVKDLDSNTLPPFLARVCSPDKPRSSWPQHCTTHWTDYFSNHQDYVIRVFA
jgi:hypothetical protein